MLVGSRENYPNPLKSKTEDLIRENPNIICVGFQKDIRPLSISNALVLPHREGFPNVILQAGSMSIPSIVSILTDVMKLSR